jgi:hypothetical protein
MAAGPALATMLLTPATWDLALDSFGNMALASTSPPNNLAQDAASAIKLFSDVGGPGVGEYWWDTTQGVPYFTQIFGRNAPLDLVKQKEVMAAISVPGVAAAQCFISALSGRQLSGQVQVVSQAGQTAAANYTVTNPQGV